MKHKTLELLVGIFVLLGIAAVAYLTIKLGSGSVANAGGLNAGSSVYVAGVPVGRVETIVMDPTDYCAIATLKIQAALKIPTDSMASIKTSGLIGDKFVALSPGAEEAFLAPGDRITMTESSVDLESLISKMAFGSVEKDSEPKSEP